MKEMGIGAKARGLNLGTSPKNETSDRRNEEIK